MIIINNNDIIFTPDEKYYNFLKIKLSKIYLLKNISYFEYAATRQSSKYNIPEIDYAIEKLNRELRQRPFDKFNSFYDVYYIYNLDDNENLVIPIGLLDFVKPYFSSNIKINYDFKNPMIKNTNGIVEKLDDKILPRNYIKRRTIKSYKIMFNFKKNNYSNSNRWRKI